MIHNQLLKNTMFGGITTYATDNPPVVNIAISGRGYNIFFDMIIQAGSQQKGLHMLQLVAAAELSVEMNAELLIQFNCIKRGHPTRELGLCMGGGCNGKQ